MLECNGFVLALPGATGWEMYLEGVFGDCSKDAVIDHAVTLIGYGKECVLHVSAPSS